MGNMVNVTSVRARDIRIVAAANGIAEIEYVGDNGKTGDARVTVYRINDVLVAATNGASVWEEQDMIAFRDLCEDEGIDIRNPAAVALGRRGGKATSEAKASAARANGRKGGRPPRKLHRPVVSAEEWQLFQEWKAGR